MTQERNRIVTATAVALALTACKPGDDQGQAEPAETVRVETVGRADIELVAKPVVAEKKNLAEPALPDLPGPLKSGHTLRTSDLKEGLAVVHKVFGAGTIRKVLDRSQGRIVVDFSEQQEVTLIVSRAPLSLPN